MSRFTTTVNPTLTFLYGPRIHVVRSIYIGIVYLFCSIWYHIDYLPLIIEVDIDVQYLLLSKLSKLHHPLTNSIVFLITCNVPKPDPAIHGGVHAVLTQPSVGLRLPPDKVPDRLKRLHPDPVALPPPVGSSEPPCFPTTFVFFVFLKKKKTCFPPTFVFCFCFLKKKKKNMFSAHLPPRSRLVPSQRSLSAPGCGSRSKLHSPLPGNTVRLHLGLSCPSCQT